MPNSFQFHSSTTYAPKGITPKLHYKTKSNYLPPKYEYEEYTTPPTTTTTTETTTKKKSKINVYQKSNTEKPKYSRPKKAPATTYYSAPTKYSAPTSSTYGPPTTTSYLPPSKIGCAILPKGSSCLVSSLLPITSPSAKK